MGRPRQTDLALFGFTDVPDLILRGWISREPGRFSLGYVPGAIVQAEMWRVNPALCQALNLEPMEAEPAALALSQHD